MQKISIKLRPCFSCLLLTRGLSLKLEVGNVCIDEDNISALHSSMYSIELPHACMGYDYCSKAEVEQARSHQLSGKKLTLLSSYGNFERAYHARLLSIRSFLQGAAK